MIRIINRQRKVKINSKKIAIVVEKMLKHLNYDDFDIGIWLTTNSTIRKYNKKYRNKDKPTDVLSFPFYDDLVPGQKIEAYGDEAALGDIIISVEFVEINLHQKEEGKLFQGVKILVAHGIAHLLGHKHETEKEFSVMTKIEKELLLASK
jgi:probable rRNA maturation factor